MMKNNTLAIAVAALLVGGVATAGFINNRPQDKAPAQGVFSPAASQSVAVDGVDGMVPASGRVAYADVLDVQPVTKREALYATVIGTDPIQVSNTTSTPQQVCEDVVVQEPLPPRRRSVGGMLVGGLIGGLVGNQVGGGNGRKAATVAGAVAGGFFGNRVALNHSGRQVVDHTDRRCHTVNNSSTSSRTVAWNVTYRNPDGTTGNMRTESKPGSRIALGAGKRTIGYDVSYRLDGKTHQVRMDQRPGSQLPIIDGQVVTKVAAVADNNRSG
jgi:uncharacterized protein YcfJ